ITDDDAAVLSIVATTQAAEDATNGVFTITTTNQFTTPTNVTLTVGGTATSGVDFTALGTGFTFPANTTSVTLTVPVIADNLVESDETIIITLTGTDNPNVSIGGTDEATVTITDDDVAELSIAATTQASEDATDGLLTITTDNQFSNAVTVNLTIGGTATEGTDYANIGTSVIFPANQSTVTIPVEVIADNIVEADETVIVTMTGTDNTDVTISATDNATITITDDDNATVTLSTASGREDDGNITVTATLDNGVQGGFSVEVSSNDGTATPADNDYTAITGQTLTFAGTAGEVQTFTISPTADNKFETDENLTVTQSNPTGTTLAVDISSSATITILDDDNATVTIADVIAAEDNGDITVTVTLDNAVDGGFTVEVNTADGTATTADNDYTAIVGQVLAFTGTAGETQTFVVSPIADGVDEDNETLSVALGSLSGTAFNIDITDGATITIGNDDSTPVITPLQSFTIAEDLAEGGNVGTIVATDADASTIFQNWLIVSGNTDVDEDSESPFIIDSSTGQITLNDADDIDFEAGNNSFTLSVTVSDGDNVSSVETIAINITDVNDDIPVITAGQSFTIDENLTNNTSVGTVAATDTDETVTTFSDWTIVSGNDLGIFAINSTTGELTIADNSSLDRETVASVILTLTVSDGVNTSEEETVAINIDDLNDNLPVISAGQSFTVSENAANDTLVGIVQANDNDITATTFGNFSIISGDTEGIFEIDATTGQLTIADNSALDFEMTESYTLVITVDDGTNTSAATNVTIVIEDQNEIPAIAGLSDIAGSEDEVASGSFTVSDPDTNLSDLTFTFAVDNETVFATDAISVTGDAENRTLSIIPNDDLFGTTQLTVTVSDGELSSSSTINVTFSPVNDAPIAILLSNRTIDEGAAIGSEVGTLSTEDIDAGDTFTYTIVSGDGDADNAVFGINGNALTVAADLDFEEGATRTVRIRSTDAAGDFTEESFIISLEANLEAELVFTTAFTPNGDGVNDTWIIDNITLHPNAKVAIINREANTVFESVGYQEPWDGTYEGKDLPVDTYYYVIDLGDGRTYEGFVMILR
ncbi:MAG: cadherin domain-containing protein, partial [Cyclobacteriaceae bacterium]